MGDLPLGMGGRCVPQIWSTRFVATFFRVMFLAVNEDSSFKYAWAGVKYGSIPTAE